MRKPPRLVDGLRGVLISQEFRERSTDLLLNEFPEKVRDLFVHIPKTGGVTITHYLANHPSVVTLYSEESLRMNWIKDWPDYLTTMAAKFVNDADQVCVTGHLKLNYVLDHNLNRETDSVFCVVREPFELIVSWINYILTAIARAGGMAQPTSDIIGWRKALDIDTNWSPVLVTDLEPIFYLIVDRLIPNDPMCTYLGLEKTADSAVEMIHRLGIGIIQFGHVDAFLATRDVAVADHRNVSEKFFHWRICRSQCGSRYSTRFNKIQSYGGSWRPCLRVRRRRSLNRTNLPALTSVRAQVRISDRSNLVVQG